MFFVVWILFWGQLTSLHIICSTCHVDQNLPASGKEDLIILFDAQRGMHKAPKSEHVLKNDGVLQMLSTAVALSCFCRSLWRMESFHGECSVTPKNKERGCQDSLIFHDSEKHQQQCHLAMAMRADVSNTVTGSEGCWYWFDLVYLSGRACMVL